MLDKEFLHKICNLECDFETLKNFNLHINIHDFNTKDSFAEFYNLETVLNALSKFQKGEIDASFLAYWANAYNWIIMSSKWQQGDNAKVANFHQFVMCAISDLLDSLSFIELDPTLDANRFEEKFVIFDKLFKTIDANFTIYFVPCNKDDPVFVNFLCINDKTKEYVEVENGYLNYGNYKVNEQQVNKTKFKELLSNYRKLGYARTKVVVENLENTL